MTESQLSMYGYNSKTEVLDDSEHYWNPDKTRFWQSEGIPLVIGRREGYVLTDIDGHEVIDVHLNGGTYNLGHRNPEIIAALKSALDLVDVGNHHFPTPGRAALAKKLVDLTPGSEKVVFGSSGGEAIDLAIKSARYATGRRKIVSIIKAYHGHTGLAIATGDDRFSCMFNSDDPSNFVHVPFNDIEKMRDALAPDNVAAVIMETVPATYGFPIPSPGYLAAVKQMCEDHGALYIADEVQTGLGRTGKLWGIYDQGVTPDILVTGKGLSGGVYPITAAILGPRAAGWLEEDGFAHMSTFGGSELGCAVAMKVLDITLRESTQRNIAYRIEQFRKGLTDIQRRHPGQLTEIRQNGLVIGLEFGGGGAKPIMSELYRQGVWAIFSTLDPKVLQFKPGLLVTESETAKILEVLEKSMKSVNSYV
ncbi:aspartate aminotransferase family protein [Corynebacterium neomassiliense]|uniref:class-III pyridoxal-phosphate-dependent aminotransferase n=1 Tax=Corynebacterium neomassiliense TaxID=2079482 RepID=UPI001EFFDF43|nr:aminotransferase class III-fold pyridoxal phosphate-dependent enzyme [Corynebacterium neomassiliense]